MEFSWDNNDRQSNLEQMHMFTLTCLYMIDVSPKQYSSLFYSIGLSNSKIGPCKLMGSNIDLVIWSGFLGFYFLQETSWLMEFPSNTIEWTNIETNDSMSRKKDQ